jgi:6-phospho-beta-glucosidase
VRVAIIGGGGFRVPLVHRALASARPEVDEVTLYDSDPARVTVIRSLLAPSPSTRVVSTLDEAVRGADFVFCAIRIGGTSGRAADERRAVEAGVLAQETVGAGGIAFALRTIPVALEIARRVATLAPDAWLVNFTNPAGIVTEAMHSVLGERVVGVCDSPSGLVRRVARAVGASEGDIEVDYAGVNHLGWLRALRVGTRDLLPSLLADTARLATFEEGRLFDADLLRALGAVPNEYLAYYYGAADMIAAARTGRTRGEYVGAEQDQFYAAASADPSHATDMWERARHRRDASYLAEARSVARDAADVEGGGYESVAVALMSALAGGPARTLIVNVANRGTLSVLPDDLVIEVPCDVTTAGASPRPTAPLDMHQLGLVAGVRAAERAALTAVRRGSKDDALAAFAIHPLIASSRRAATLLTGTLADHPALDQLLR